MPIPSSSAAQRLNTYFIWLPQGCPSTGSEGALKKKKKHFQRQLQRLRLIWVKLQMADGTGKEENYILKVELPNKSGTSHPKALHPRAEIRAWNLRLKEPQMSSFQLEV